jgi:hypothetical protein
VIFYHQRLFSPLSLVERGRPPLAGTAHDNGDKFIPSDNDTGYKFIAGVVVRVCEMSMDAPAHCGSRDSIGGRVRLRRPEMSPFWLEVVLAASEA